MKGNFDRKKTLKVVAAVGILVLMSFLILLLTGELRNLFEQRHYHSFQVSELPVCEDPREGKEQKNPVSGIVRYLSDESVEYEDPICVRIDLPHAYINRLVFHFSHPENRAITIVTDDGSGRLRETDTVSFGQIPYSVKDPHRICDQIYLIFEREDLPYYDVVEAENRHGFPWRRLVLAFAVSIAVTAPFFYKLLWREKPALLFLAITIPAGIAMIFSHGYANVSWDEALHYGDVYRISYVGDVLESEGYDRYINDGSPETRVWEEASLFGDYWNELDANYLQTSEQPHSALHVYNGLGHAFQAFFMGIFRALGAGFSKYFFIANLANLLEYVIITALAIHIAKYGKYLLFFVGMMITPMTLATSYSYDAHLICFVFLGVALYTAEYAREDQPRLKRVIPAALVMLIGCLTKVVAYLPLLLLFCFFPKKKFVNAKQQRKYVIAALIIFVLFTLLIITTMIVFDDGGMSDPRVSGTDAVAQIEFIFHNPLYYLKILAKEMWTRLTTHMFGGHVLFSAAYQGSYIGILVYLTPILLVLCPLFAGCQSEGEESLTSLRIGVLVCSFLAAVLINTSLYLSYTEVGGDDFPGVQGRYFIPLIYPVFLVFVNRKWKLPVSKNTLERVLLPVMSVCCLWVIWIMNYARTGSTWS